MFNIKVSMFFDRAGVMAKVKDGTKSVLSKFGSFVRQRAKTSIRKSKKSATPGNPPRSHVGYLRDRIFFGYDTRTESVVIGPQLLNHVHNPPIPAVLEYGGKSKNSKGNTVSYEKYPFMKPAMEAELPKFQGLFAHSVR